MSKHLDTFKATVFYRNDGMKPQIHRPGSPYFALNQCFPNKPSQWCSSRALDPEVSTDDAWHTDVSCTSRSCWKKYAQKHQKTSKQTKPGRRMSPSATDSPACCCRPPWGAPVLCIPLALPSSLAGAGPVMSPETHHNVQFGNLCIKSCINPLP